MSLSTALLALVGSLLISAFYSGSETGFYALNRIRLRHRLADGDRRARALSWAIDHPQVFIFTILVGNNLANFLGSTVATNIYLDFGVPSGSPDFLLGFLPWNAELACTYTLTPLFFLFAEVTPKNLLRARANTLMYRFTVPLRISWLLYAPLTYPLRLLTRGLGGQGAGEAELAGLSRRRLRVFFAESATEGTVTKHQNDMVANVLTMRSTPVTRAMIPIQQAITAAAGARITELPSVIRTSGINRVAVYRGNVRDVIGMVHVFDLMNEELDPQTPVEDLARSAFRISRKYTLQQAFYRLRQHHQSFALVTDEAGRCVGLVTLEDIARHIVGEAPRGVPQSAA